MHWTVYLEGGPRRVNHAAAAVGNLIYSFGGYSSSNVQQFRTPYEPIDVHIFNTMTMKWKTLKPPKKAIKTSPFQRYGHTVVSYNSLIYLWGGRNDNNSCNKVYCFDTDTNTWSRPVTYATIPPARDGHSACIIDSKMYIFGGFEEEFERYSQDVYALDLKTMHWSYIVTQGESPIYRDFNSGTALGNRMYIFGGRSDLHGAHSFEGETYPTSLVYLDLATMRWVQPTVSGTPPCGRRSHSAFVYNEKLYIFGGYNGLLNKHYNDLHEYCPINSVWRQVGTIGKPPSARRRQAAIVIHNLVFLFGGTSPSSNSPNTTIDYSNVALMDHDDLFILDLSPSLKTLSLLAVKNYNLDASCMPAELKREINLMADAEEPQTEIIYPDSSTGDDDERSTRGGEWEWFIDLQ